MDITKVKAAITTAQGELKKLVDATVDAGKKDSRQFNGLKNLGSVDKSLEAALEGLDGAVKRVAPRVKKAKKADKK